MLQIEQDILQRIQKVHNGEETSSISDLPTAAYQCDNDKFFTLGFMSDGFFNMLGYTREEIKERFENHLTRMIHPDDLAKVVATVKDHVDRGANIQLKYRVIHKNGNDVWVLDRGRLLDDGNGNRCFYCLLTDISKRNETISALIDSLERYQIVLNQSNDIIFEWDIIGDELFFSSNWEKKFGYKAIHNNISTNIPLSKNLHPDDIASFIKLIRDVKIGIAYSETEIRLRTSEGKFIWCRIRTSTQYNENKRPVKAVGIILDIDSEKRHTDALIEQVQLDALTGLYNKSAINHLVEQGMRGLSGKGSQALLIIDLDYFKEVNDTYGHLCGDSLLSDVSAILKGHTRKAGFAGRIGGDEFMIYMPHVMSEDAAVADAEKLLESLQTLIPEGGSAPITCSIGVAVFPRSATDFLQFYRCADIALYFRKHSGRAGVSLYSPEYSYQFDELTDISAVNNTIDFNDGKVSEDMLPRYVFRTLCESVNIEKALNMLLEIIGRSYDVSRVYIVEPITGTDKIGITMEWCNEGIERQKDDPHNLISDSEWVEYQNNFNKNGIFLCSDSSFLTNTITSGIIQSKMARSVLQCAIMDESIFYGAVCFDECIKNRVWSHRQVADFKLTAHTLATFVLRLRSKQALNRLLHLQQDNL